MKKFERIAIPLGMIGILFYLSHTLLGRILWAEYNPVTMASIQFPHRGRGAKRGANAASDHGIRSVHDRFLDRHGEPGL
jgi:hypothetical protein